MDSSPRALKVQQDNITCFERVKTAAEHRELWDVDKKKRLIILHGFIHCTKKQSPDSLLMAAC